MRTTATRGGDHFRLNGTKLYITNGPVAEFLGMDAGRDEQHVEPGVVGAAEVGLRRVADREHGRGIDRTAGKVSEAAWRTFVGVTLGLAGVAAGVRLLG